MDKYVREQLLAEDPINCLRLYSARNNATGEAVALHERYHDNIQSAESIIQFSANLGRLQSIPGVLQTIESYVYGQYLSVIVTEPVTRTLKQELQIRRETQQKWPSSSLRGTCKLLLEMLESAHSLDFCHGSITDSFLYLTPAGEWKLGGFEQSHFNFQMGGIDPNALKPYLSKDACAYIQHPADPIDWHQADLYSLGVALLAMAALGDIDFLWQTQSDKHAEAILKLDCDGAVIEVIAGMVTDALGEKTTLKQAICLLEQHSSAEKDQPEDGGKQPAEDEKEELYTCSYCSEKTGKLNGDSFHCINPECSQNSSGSPAFAFCPICSQPFNPANPWTSPLVSDDQKSYISLVCSYPCLEKLLSLESSKQCSICSATPPKDCDWHSRHPEVESTQLLDLCSFACYIVHCQMIGAEQRWGQVCIQCGRSTKTIQKVIRLECSEEHAFCGYKCMKVFAKGHGNTDVLCPVCAVAFNFPQKRTEVKGERTKSAGNTTGRQHVK